MENFELNQEATLLNPTPTVTLNPNTLFPPLRLVLCEDFQHLPSGTAYSPGSMFTGQNGLRYTIAYSGGARISTHSNPSTHFLEGVGQGAMIIEMQPPFKTDLFELELLQAGNDPIEVRYYSNFGQYQLGTTYTSVYNQTQRITVQGQNLTTILLTGTEVLVKSICYGLIVQP